MRTDPVAQIARASVLALRDAYADAIAASLVGDDAADVWERLRVGYERSVILTRLTAAAQVWRQVPRVERAKKDDPFDLSIGSSVFEEAVAAILGREPRLRSTVDLLRDLAAGQARMFVALEMSDGLGFIAKRSTAIQEAIRRSFWVSGVDAPTVVNLRELVAETIRTGATPKGITLPEFIDRAQLEGAAGLTRARLENVLRTNLSTAANEAHADTLRAPEVRIVLPLVELMEIKDRRSRPHHAQMDGYINTIEVFDALQLWPPNGFQCRGSTRGVTIVEAQRMGLVRPDGTIDHEAIRRRNGMREMLIGRGVYPDAGFGVAA